MQNKNIAEKCNIMLIKIGLNITHYRKSRNMTQKQLAKKAGVSIITIANIENINKLYNIKLITLFDIADALNISADKLFHFKDEDD